MNELRKSKAQNQQQVQDYKKQQQRHWESHKTVPIPGQEAYYEPQSSNRPPHATHLCHPNYDYNPAKRHKIQDKGKEELSKNKCILM
jgi:hypothetical protein